MLVVLTGHRGHLVSETRQARDRDAADATGCTRDDDRSAPGRSPICSSRTIAEPRGEAGRAQGHRVEQRQAGRERHDPIGGHPHIPGISTVVRTPRS